MKNIILPLLVTILAAGGCRKNNNPDPGSKILDYGYTSPSSASGPDRMFHYKGNVFVGTDDGVWKIGVGEKRWHQAGLHGKKISSIYSHPEIEGAFYAGIVTSGPAEKSLFISREAGKTWEAAASPVFTTFGNHYETYFDLETRPEHPGHLFASLTGTTIAVSKDTGQTWHRQNYIDDSYFGDFCIIHFLASRPNEIYQGAEAPLDHAWLGKYGINASDPVRLDALQQIIGKQYEWGNRRPNCIESFASSPGILYVGMEGALSKVEGSTYKYLFRQGEDTSGFPYTYVKGIWVDPANSQHILFGGGVNGNNTSLSLYETHDEGRTIVQIKDKLGMQDPDIIDIVPTDTFPAILIRDNGNGNKLKLVLYDYSGGGKGQ